MGWSILKNLFKISYRISPYQDFLEGSLVTYKDENRLDLIKETLLSRTNFFYIKESSWKDNYCQISNGIDSIATTTDQLVELIAYVEKKTEENSFKNTLKQIANNKIINIESYILYNQEMGVYLEESVFSKKYFSLVNVTVGLNVNIKTYKSARFIESKLHEIL